MILKFFTFSCFFIFLSTNSFGAESLILQDTSSGKIVEIKKGTKVFFQQASDSILNIEMKDDYGIITMVSDSSFFTEEDIEIPFNDLKYLKVVSKRTELLKKISTPFLGIGIGVFARGIYQASFEGFEKDNKVIVPIELGGGAIVTGLSLAPFLIKPKLYKLQDGPWELSSK